MIIVREHKISNKNYRATVRSRLTLDFFNFLHQVEFFYKFPGNVSFPYGLNVFKISMDLLTLNSALSLYFYNKSRQHMKSELVWMRGVRRGRVRSLCAIDNYSGGVFGCDHVQGLAAVVWVEGANRSEAGRQECQPRTLARPMSGLFSSIKSLAAGARAGPSGASNPKTTPDRFSIHPRHRYRAKARVFRGCFWPQGTQKRPPLLFCTP